MNICFFHAGFSNVGGIERVVSILLEDMSAKEEHKLYSLEYAKVENRRVYDTNEKVCVVNLFEKSMSMTRAIIKHHIIRRVRSFLKENNIDVIIACGVLYFPVAVLAAKHTKTKVVCWEHTNPYVSNNYRFQKISRMFGIKHSYKNVVITEKALNFYNNVRKNKNVLIYNPVDQALFDNAPIYNSDSKKVISVGRLCYAKNYDLLIEIAQKVLSDNKDWSWDIYGGGEDYERLKQKIQLTDVSDRLTLKGSVNDIYDRYKDYSFIVMTSRYEGFPMALLEASAKALPMVSFDIDTGPSEIINDGQNGYLIENNNKDSMIQKINLLMSDSDNRIKMSANAYGSSKNFSIEIISKKWNDFFEELIL